MKGAAAALALAVALRSVSASVVQYNYTAGGQTWNATAGWATCGNTPTSKQSPINIADSISIYNAAFAPLQLSYGKSAAWTLEITVNYMEVAEIDTVTTGAGAFTANTFTDGMTLDGTFIPLNQFHFHSPSEHSINGVHYPLEMHMVHKLYTSDGTLTGTRVAPTVGGAVLAKAAVIGIMFAYDPADADGAFLAKLMPVFQKMTPSVVPDVSDDTSVNVTSDTTDTTYGGDLFFNLTSDIFGIIGTSAYYRYNGSLTTPPCTEGINWVNMANPLTLSSRQLLAFTKLLATEQGGDSRGGDNRLIQPLNGRPIYTSVAPPSPTLIGGTLQFNTNLAATSMAALETQLTAALAIQLGVDASDVNLGTFTDVAAASGSGTDVAVTYTVSVPNAAAASQVSAAIAAGTVIPSGATMSAMASALQAANSNFGIASIAPATAAVSAADPTTAFAAMVASNTALSANVASLAAALTLLQSNVTAQVTALNRQLLG